MLHNISTALLYMMHKTKYQRGHPIQDVLFGIIVQREKSGGSLGRDAVPITPCHRVTDHSACVSQSSAPQMQPLPSVSTEILLYDSL